MLTNVLVRRSFSNVAGNVSTTESIAKLKPLQGIRVLEMGQLLAGPFTTTLLGYYGAEVVS